MARAVLQCLQATPTSSSVSSTQGARTQPAPLACWTSPVSSWDRPGERGGRELLPGRHPPLPLASQTREFSTFSLPSCGLPGSSFWLQATPGVAHGLTVNANQPGVPAGTYRLQGVGGRGLRPECGSPATAHRPTPSRSRSRRWRRSYVVTAVSELDFNAQGSSPSPCTPTRSQSNRREVHESLFAMVRRSVSTTP